MTHVLIIGGGVIGLATAYRLAVRHARVTLLERDTLFSGASGSSLGALWPSRPAIKGPLQTLQRLSLWQFEEFLDQLSAAAAIPIRFRRPGHLELLTDEKARDQAIADASAAVDWPTFGHPQALAYLPPDDLRRQFPALTPAADGRFGALHSRVTAYVDLASLAAALRTACIRHGVVIHEHTPVTDLTFAHGAITAVVTPARAFAADIFLAATGAWSAQLHPLIAACAQTRPSKGQAVEITLPPDAPPVPPLIIRQKKTYIVPWPDPNPVGGLNVLIGSTTEPEAGFDTTVHDDAIRALLDRAIAFVPALRHARITRAWAGLRPDARKHQPIMGRVPATTNLFVAAGHFKTGIGLAPLVSTALADLLLNTPSAYDLTPFAPRLERAGNR